MTGRKGATPRDASRPTVVERWGIRFTVRLRRRVAHGDTGYKCRPRSTCWLAFPMASLHQRTGRPRSGGVSRSLWQIERFKTGGKS